MEDWKEIKDNYARDQGYNNWSEFLHAEDGRLKERVLDDLSIIRAKKALKNANSQLTHYYFVIHDDKEISEEQFKQVIEYENNIPS